MALAFVAEQLHASPAALRDYGARSQTRTEHLQQIQRYLGFHDATREDLRMLANWLLVRALEERDPGSDDLLGAQMIADELKQQARLVVFPRTACHGSARTGP